MFLLEMVIYCFADMYRWHVLICGLLFHLSWQVCDVYEKNPSWLCTHSYPVIAPHDSEFNNFVPRKSVYELVHTVEDGLFVVLARIVSCFQVEKIWYPLCGCESVMTEKNGLFVCGKCNLSTFNASIK